MEQKHSMDAVIGSDQVSAVNAPEIDKALKKFRNNLILVTALCGVFLYVLSLAIPNDLAVYKLIFAAPFLLMVGFGIWVYKLRAESLGR